MVIWWLVGIKSMIFLDINQNSHFLGDGKPLEILDLHAEMRGICNLDFIEGKRGNNTGIVFTLEYCLGIAENNFPGADFKYNGKSVELKTRRNSSSSRMTLFTKTPVWDPLSAKEIIEKYGYKGSRIPYRPLISYSRGLSLT